MRKHKSSLLISGLCVCLSLFLCACDPDLGSKMSNAAINTLMGMGVVFLVLILISYVIKAFGIINRLEQKKAKKNQPEETESVISAVEEPEETADDKELVAVIAAAIAAYEGTTPDGICVRSIRKVSEKRNWKRG